MLRSLGEIVVRELARPAAPAGIRCSAGKRPASRCAQQGLGSGEDLCSQVEKSAVGLLNRLAREDGPPVDVLDVTERRHLGEAASGVVCVKELIEAETTQVVLV